MAAELALRWLRGSTKRASGDDRGGDAPTPDVGRLARQARRELLSAISDFLLENDLAVNPENLSAAYNALSGNSPSLGRRVAERRASAEGISQSWLRSVCADPADQPDEDAPRRLTEELDRSLKVFARSASAARSATSDYGAQLDRHASELHKLDLGDAASGLASIAREMADRARSAEAKLEESEREAKALRRQLSRAKRDAERDHLTGLPNRRAFDAELQRQYAEAKAAQDRLCVAFCDVDHFKLVNDRHGHEAGDRSLKFIARALNTISDKNCHVARHGGEEFVMLFRGATVPEAVEKLDKVRARLAARRLVNRETGEPIGQISFSAGVADAFAYPAAQDALRAADEALLQAKDQGRNRVIAAQKWQRRHSDSAQ